MAEQFQFDPFDERTRRNPFPLYAQARREHPVYRHEGLPVVSVFRYDDIQAILRDPSTWSNVFPPPPGFTRPDHLPPSMLMLDPPEHTRLRGLVQQAFTPRRVRELEPRIEVIAEQLASDLVTRGMADFVATFAYPLPVVVIAEMIGVPAEDRELFRHWSDALVENLGGGLLGPPSPEALAKELAAVEAMRAYFVERVEERRRKPREDLLSALVAAELEGSRLTFDEMLQMLVLLLVAGNETTRNLIANAVYTLIEYPESERQLRAHPEHVPGAVEEVLRFASPVQCDVRYLVRDTEVAGRHVEAGTIALLWLGSANRDESVFPDPDVFDIARADNRHLAFGFGPHFCLGANLARLEAQVALRVLLRRVRQWQLATSDPLPLHPSLIFRAMTELPLEVRG
jgi:cytochrome P450